MARYNFDHCEIGSRHDGGLGSVDDLDEAMRLAARGIDRHGPDVYAQVYDSETGRHLEVRRRAIDGGPPLTPRRTLTLLREQADADGWTRPAHRPRRDPGAARVIKSYSVHPDSAAKIAAEAQRTGKSQGQVIDRLVQGLDHG